MNRLAAVRATIGYVAIRAIVAIALVAILGLAVVKNLHDFGLLADNPGSFLLGGLLGFR